MTFSIWRHSVEQVYLDYNHNKPQHCVRITCLSGRGGGDKGNLVFTYEPIVRTKFAYFSKKNHPISTILHFAKRRYNRKRVNFYA